MIWKREQPFQMDGQTVKVPLPASEGTGLAKPLKIIKPGEEIRPDIPIWWASLMGLSVSATATMYCSWRSENGWGARFMVRRIYHGRTQVTVAPSPECSTGPNPVAAPLAAQKRWMAALQAEPM